MSTETATCSHDASHTWSATGCWTCYLAGHWHGRPAESASSGYPCAQCGGTGVARLDGRSVCNRCSGSGIDPYVDRDDSPSHLWSCGCLVNDAGAHRVGCPDHPEGVRGC